MSNKNKKIIIKDSYSRPTWAEIDLSAIRYNFHQIKKMVPGAIKILPAVKANAYGHGLIEIARELVDCGADYLGVGTLDEAIALKKASLNIPILNLTSITNKEIDFVLKHNIIQTIPNIILAKKLNAAAAKKCIKPKVHLKIDTGMGRLGVWHNEAMNFISKVLKLQNLRVDGIFTHFANADEDIKFTNQQFDNFSSLLGKLKDQGIEIKNIHAANSAGILNCPKAHLNVIRPGIMIYGLYPNIKLKHKIKLKPAMSLRSEISYIKNMPPRRKIGYGSTYVTKCHSRIALIPIGYGDGYSRLLSNKGEVLIRGKRAPIVGRVCMDQIMVDISNINRAATGDKVILMGEQKGEKITAEEIAVKCLTIPYEVICWISSRVPRLFLKK